MSDEHFDKQIKKQLESVKPPLRADAWKNFRQLLPPPWYVVLFRKYGGWMYGGISTLAILTTSYLYIQENKENRKLHETIVTLSKPDPTNINKITPNPAAPGTVLPDTIKSVTRPDTIYLAEKKYVPQPAVKNKALNPRPAVPHLPERPEALVNEDASPQRQEQPADDKVQRKNNAGNNNPANNSSTTTAPSTNNSRPSTDSAEAVNQLQPQSPDIAKQDAGQIRPQPDSGYIAASKEQNKPASNFRVRPAQARVGLNFDFAGFRKFAWGPGVDLFLSDRFSLGTGLLISNPEEEKHFDAREFNRAKGKRFEDLYRQRVPPNDRIEKINLKTTVFRLPLALTYYFPAKGSFSFLMTGGTNLELSVIQQVNFESSWQGVPEFNKFQARQRPNIFNNLFYGVGVQYQYGRLIGQLTPYYNYQFVDPEYYSPASRIGINATFKFNLKKPSD